MILGRKYYIKVYFSPELHLTVKIFIIIIIIIVEKINELITFFKWSDFAGWVWTVVFNVLTAAPFIFSLNCWSDLTCLKREAATSNKNKKI